MSATFHKHQNLLNNQLSHGQLIQFHKNIVDDALPTIAAIPQLANVAADYQAKFTAMDNYFAKLRKRYETKVLVEKDKDRDYVTRSIAGKIRYFQKFPQTPAEKDDIDRLFVIYETYEAADRKDYEAETTFLRSFIAELRKFPALLTKFNLTEMVDNLEQLNNDFETVYNNRTLILHDLKESGNIAHLREATNAAFINITQAITGLSLMPVTDAVMTSMTTIVGIINANIEQFTTTYHRHAGVVASQKKKDKEKNPDKQKPDTSKPAAPNTPPQNPDTTNPPAPDTPPQNPDTGKPNIDPDELNPPAVGE